MEDSSQIQDPAASNPAKEHPVSADQQIQQVPELIGMLWATENVPVSEGNRTKTPGVEPITHAL
jgi:hypothetical protein